MKGRVVLLLFALPFFGVGVWMAYSVSSTFYEAWQMKQWVPVTATLTRAGYESKRGDNSYTYEAYADYSYQYEGIAYSNDRVAIAGGADNIGDFQQVLGDRLSAAMSRGDGIVIYVNPGKPEEAIVDRSVRWGLIGFKSIFVFGFGGIGLGLIYFSLRAKKEKDLSDPKYSEQPWLANEDWQTALITSSSKTTMYFTWGFAAFWNLISAPLPFVIYREIVQKENYLALVGLLFPMVGAGLIVWALRRTLEWRRFGPAPLSLDPFPGSIGGHVGGIIDVKLPYDSYARFSLTLTNLYSYMSGSGKDRSRKSSAEWQDTQVAHATSGVQGTRLSFRFDVPKSLNESDAEKTEDSYYLWQLNLKAELPGIDIDRDYEIPVYATEQQSQELSNFSIAEARADQRQIDLAIIKKIVRLDYGIGGRSMLYPAGRNLWNGFMGILFGVIFAGAGWFLVTEAGHAVMGAVFGGVGLLVLVSAVYFALNSLEIVAEGGDIRTVRRVLGFPVKRMRMRSSDFVRFDKKKSSYSQSGTRHVVHYSLHAVDKRGQKMVVGEGFKGISQADAAAELIAREFGLSIQAVATEPGSDEINLLTTD
jgi:hypothetical protein